MGNGWKLVPIEPTIVMMNAVSDEMRGTAPWIENGLICWLRGDQNKIYRAMVEAAPEYDRKDNSSFVPVPKMGTIVPTSFLLAIAAVLEADDEYRASLPKDYDRNPLLDEIDGLRRAFEKGTA